MTREQLRAQLAEALREAMALQRLIDGGRLNLMAPRIVRFEQALDHAVAVVDRWDGGR